MDKNYKELLIEENTKLSYVSNTIFIGYGLKKGRALGSLKNISDNQIIEMPVAENLLIGFAIGLSLMGYRPIVFIERMDFIMNAMDSLVNHLDKIQKKSLNEFSPAIIIRCIVGNKNKPLYTGITHTQDFSEALGLMVSIPIIQILDKEQITKAYNMAKENLDNNKSTILVEYKDLI
jgi:pyruvate/2-oxoglutarate/acetoin dehydrogenase E1 component